MNQYMIVIHDGDALDYEIFTDFIKANDRADELTKSKTPHLLQEIPAIGSFRAHLAFD